MGRRKKSEDSDAFDQLTQRERAMLAEVTRTDKDRPPSITEAYRRAYSTENSSPVTITNNASKVFRRPAFQKALKKEKDRLEAERLRAMKSTRSAIESTLWQEIQKESTSTRDRIAALRVLASMTKPPEKEDVLENSAASKEEVVDQLRKLLESSLGAPLDITPKDSAVAVIEDVDMNSNTDGDILEIGEGDYKLN